MRKPQWRALGALLGTLALVLLAATSPSPAQTQRPAKRLTLRDRLVRASKLQNEQVDRLLASLGPALRDHLRAGEQVDLAGVGVFRVVRIPEHRDLVNGRPAIIPARNYVEFLPAGPLVDASNAPGAVPAVTVPPFEYNPLPTQTPSERVPSTRQPPTRVR